MSEEVVHGMVIPAMIAFAVSAILGPVVIPLLQRLKVGQTVRSAGPATHLVKAVFCFFLARE